MTRPKKKASEKRSYTLQVKLSKAERAAIERAAVTAGMDVSTFVRVKTLELIRRMEGADAI